MVATDEEESTEGQKNAFLSAASPVESLKKVVPRCFGASFRTTRALSWFSCLGGRGGGLTSSGNITNVLEELVVLYAGSFDEGFTLMLDNILCHAARVSARLPKGGWHRDHGLASDESGY